MRYQRPECTQFFAPPDWVVANLSDDWATLSLVGVTTESARALQELAISYGVNCTLLMQRRIEHIGQIVVKAEYAEAKKRSIAL